MLIPVQHLIDRIRHPRSRADELAAVRRRLVAMPSASGASTEEREAAERLRRLRVELSAALQDVRACGRCAKGHPLPHGHWDGGHCCGGRTEHLFTDDELAALRLSGTTPERLVPPSSDHAGCVFRGPRGCSLDVADRPSLCVRYLCVDLERELAARGDLTEIRALASEVTRTFARFQHLRAAHTPPPWSTTR